LLGLGLIACRTDPGERPKRKPGPNRPSVGFIDLPTAGSTVDPLVPVSGWAVDESGIKAVRIYFDDELMATVTLVLARPDVDLAFPQFTKPGAVHGFNTIVPARAHAGYTLIRTEAIDGLGALTPLYSVTVKIRE
jgi:hypothetical protein